MRGMISAVVVALVLVVAGFGGGDPLGDEAAAGDVITVGSANFPESELLAEIYAQALEARQVKVNRRLNIGARELYLKALDDGSIDLLPEYNGALLAALIPGGSVPPELTAPDAVYAELVKHLPGGVIALPQSAAEDKDTLSVTPETAARYQLKTIEDLAPVAGGLVIAGGPEFAERHQGLVGLRDVYGVGFKEFKPLDSGGPLSLNALVSGEVQVANIFSTNAALTQNRVVALTDTRNLFLSQNVLPVLREAKATPTVRETLNRVSAALTTENLTAALARVTEDKQSPATVAGAFLTDFEIR